MERHECTGPDCKFCRWRQAHPIELGWEKLLEGSETDGLSVDFEMSTQQTVDILADLDYEDFPSVDAAVDRLLAEIEAEADKIPSVPQGPSNRVYGSPKSDRAVRNAIATGIPAKTKQQTDWTLRVWEQWSTSRNTQLLLWKESYS